MFFYKGRYTAGKMTISLLSLMFCIIIFSLTSSSQATDNGYEQPVQFKASTILKPELLKGKNHKVLDQVKNDGRYAKIYDKWIRSTDWIKEIE